MMEIQSQALKPKFSPHLQNNALKPAVPPKPKIFPCSSQTAKTSTATQVNLLRRPVSSSSQRFSSPSATSRTPIKTQQPSSSSIPKPILQQSQQTKIVNSATADSLLVNNDGSNVIRKKQEKVYIRKTEVRKISETTVVVKPQIPPKPAAFKPQVNFANVDTKPPSKLRGILKQSQPVTRSNSAVNSRSTQQQLKCNLRPVQSFNEKCVRPSPPAAIVFTGWKKSQTFPVITNPPNEIQYYYATNGCPLNCLRLSTAQQRRDRKSQLTALSTNHTQPFPPVVPKPIPPPRTKRKSLAVINPTNNLNNVNTTLTQVIKPPCKSSPIYAKVNRSRKTAYKRNIRRYYTRLTPSACTNENIEKSSLLISDDRNQDNVTLQSDLVNGYEPLLVQPLAPAESEQMNQTKDPNCVVVAVKMKPTSVHSTSPVSTSPNEDRRGRSPIQSDWNHNVPQELSVDQNDKMEDCVEAPPSELPDNSSFLFRLLKSAENTDLSKPDDKIKENLYETVSKEEGVEDMNTITSRACPKPEIVSSSSTNLEENNEHLEAYEDQPLTPSTLTDEIPQVVISPPEYAPSQSVPRSPLISEIAAILETKNISFGSAEKICDKVAKKEQRTESAPNLLSTNQGSDVEDTADCPKGRPKPRRKTSLIELVDNKIHKMQSLIAEFSSNSNEASSRKSLLTIENDVPRTVLLRKSSVPELCSAVLNEMLTTCGKKDADMKLTRSSWANMSTSSVGSSSSSSSAPVSIKTMKVGDYRKNRRMSEGALWADEGDTSTGAMGDVENSPYHSSNEEGKNPSSEIRPHFHRRRRIGTNLFGKARKSGIIAHATIIWKHHSSHKKSTKAPKIEVLLPESSSSDSKDTKAYPNEDKEDDWNLELEEKRRVDAEIYDQVAQSLSPESRKAYYVVREILTSEQTFVNVLELITTDFPDSIRKTAERLKTNPNSIVSDADLDRILGGLPTLKCVNENLYQDLEERAKNWTKHYKISDIFVKKGPFLKHYTYYIKEFEKINNHFDQLYQKCPNFSRAVKEFEMKKRCNHLGLKAYMLKPVQRMPQYSLLLEDYLKHLPKDHVDYEDTVKAIAVVRGVAEHANEAIRSQIAVEQLVALQKRVPHIRIIDDGVQLVKQGDLLKVRRKELQQRFFSLITNSLLCFTYHGSLGKDLKLKYKLPLARMQVFVPPSVEHECEFTIISTVRSFSVIAKSLKQRDEWIEALNKTIQEFSRRQPNFAPVIKEEDSNIDFLYGKQAPVWIQDSRVNDCQSCFSEFSMTFRRHHCRSCGKVVCRLCSPYEAPLEYLNFETARVCTSCYEILLREFEAKYEDKDSAEYGDMRHKFKCLHTIRKDSYINDKRRGSKGKSKKISIHEEDDEKLVGYLLWKEKKHWVRNWFSLIGNTLYAFDSSEDAHAIRAIHLSEYCLESVQSEDEKDENEKITFKLVRKGQPELLFHSENPLIGERWINVLSGSLSSTIPIPTSDV